MPTAVHVRTVPVHAYYSLQALFRYIYNMFFSSKHPCNRLYVAMLQWHKVSSESAVEEC